MSPVTVGILHPGQMGAAIAAQARKHGATVLWSSAGRTHATVQRAEDADLERVYTLADLLDRAQIVLSICPPANAEDVAAEVANCRYHGIYVDGNAISPQRYERIAARLSDAGADVLDGAIIGPPPHQETSARFYLAGHSNHHTAAVAELFTATAVHPVVMDTPAGSASALKMAYASYQKATRTLAAVAHALAAEHGVQTHLVAEAERARRSPLAEQDYLPSVAARAWRWAPEMHEIAATLTDSHLPADLADATAVILAGLSSCKDKWNLSPEEVFAALHESSTRIK